MNYETLHARTLGPCPAAVYGVPPKPNPKPSQPDLHQRPWQVSLANIAATSGVQTTYLAQCLLLTPPCTLNHLVAFLSRHTPASPYTAASLRPVVSPHCRYSADCLRKQTCRDQPLQFLLHPIAFDQNREEHIFRSDYRLARAPRLHRARHGSEFLVEELYIVITLKGSGLRLEARFWDEQHTRSS